MNRLIGKKILILLAIWLLTGGLALADSFDLTDELQHSLIDRTCALEIDLDEVRECLGDAVAFPGMREPYPARDGGAFSEVPPCSDLVVLALLQPLPHELCPMPQPFRKMYTNTDPVVQAAVKPILLEHRDFIYHEYLELPIDL